MDQEPDRLTFDEPSHTYALNGVQVPSVTAVLDATVVDLLRVPPAVLEQARARGQAVHSACELFDQGKIDYATIDARLWPYLTAWDRFKADTKFEAELIEHRVYSKRHGFAGTLDRYGRGLFGRTRTMRPALLDAKTSELITHATGVQLSAYEMAGWECGAIKARNVLRFGVHLYDNGKYELEPYDSAQDAAVFLAALQIYHYQKRRSKR